MADDWGNNDQVVLPSYKQESNLKQIAAFSPAEQEDVTRQESMPAWDDELDAEMERQKNNPKALALLQQEKDKRSQQWGQDDKIAQAGWGHNDQEVTTSTLGDNVRGVLGAVGDIVAPVGTAYGGLHGLVDLAKGKSLDQAVQDIQAGSQYNPSHLLMDNPDQNKAYKLVNTPIEKLGELADTAGGKVTDITGSPLAGTAANVGLQTLAMAAGLKAVKGILPKGAAKVIPGEKGVSADAKAVDDLLGGPPKPKSGPLGPQDTIHVDSTGTAVPDALMPEYEAAKQRFADMKAQVPEGTQGELNFEPPSQPPYEKPGTLFDPENVKATEDATKAAADQAKTEALDKAFPKDHPAIDVLGEEYDKALEQRQEQANAQDPMAADVDEFQPSQQSPNQVPMKLGLTNRFRGQTGAAGDLDTARRVQELNQNLLTLSRDRNLFTEGRTVRLMNGKTGVIVKVAGDRYQIRMDGGAMDTVPVQGIDYAYKPANQVLSDARGYAKGPGKKQAGQGDMFKDLATFLAKGVDGLRDSFLKRPDADSYKPTYNAQEIKDIVRKGLVESNTFDAFQQRMEMEGLSDTVMSKLNYLWRDKDAVIERAGKSQFSDMNAADRKQADDTKRDYNTMVKETGLSMENKPKDDTGLINRGFNVMNVSKFINSNRDVGPVLKWVISNVNKIIGDGINVYKQLTPHLEPYMKLSTDEQKHFINTAIKFDGINNDMLKSAGLQWASDDMLRKEGFNEAQINAYKELTAGLDKAWKLVQQTFRERGQEPPAQIPGYFPHIWHGSYRLMVKDANGKLIKMYAYPTYWQALAHEKFNIKEGLQTEIISPDTYPKSHNIAADIIDHLSLNTDRPLDRAIIKKLERAEEFAKRGIVTELIERKANLGGYMGEDGLASFSPVTNKRLLNIYNTYMEDVANHYANSRIAQEVWQPFFKDAEHGLYENVPTFVHTVEDFVGRATGHPTNHLRIVDSLARAMMKTVGLPPNGINSFFKGGAQLLYYTKLSAGNVVYAASQMLQPLVGIRNITRVHGERVIRGDPTGNMLSAVGQGLSEYVKWEQGQGSADTMAVMKYVKDKGIIDTHQVDALDPSNTAKRIINKASFGIAKGLERLEARNRAASVLMFYKYFKDAGMSQTEAIRAAASQMGLVMGEYAKHQSAGMYTDLGMVGHQMRPFGILQNTYLGEAYMNLQLISDAMKAAKEGKISPLRASASLAPLGMMTANMVFFAGLSGVVGYQDYNALVAFHNKLFPKDPWLEAGAKLRQLGFSTPSIYGMLGNLIPGKPNIGPSINMPAFSDVGRFPGVSVAMQEATLAKALIDRATGNPVSWESVSQALQRIAPGWSGQWLAEWAGSKMNNNVPNSAASFTKNTVKRTKEESDVARITGRPNITEQAERDTTALVDRANRQDDQWISQQVHILTDLVEGFPGPDLIPTVNKILAEKRGAGAEILDKVLKLHEQRMMDTDQRQRMRIVGSDGERLARYKQIYDMMHGR